jgi:hypothetical protein
MGHSKQLAGLIGPTLIVLAASEAQNLHIWAADIAPLTYLNGTLLFIAGLAIVRTHNLGTCAWPVLIVLVAGLLFGPYPNVCSGASTAH